MIYLIILIYLAILVYIYDIVDVRNGRTANYVFAYILLVALMTIRYRVGGDTINYITNFEIFTPELQNLTIFQISNFQPIPAFIFSFVKTYLHDFIYIQAIFAVFVNGVVFWFLKANTKYYYTALFFYALCFFMRFNCEIMRESLAISFFLLGYRYLINKSYIKYYIYALLAFMCHASAIFILILPFFYSSIRLFWKIIIGTCFVIGYSFLIPNYILDLVNHYISSYSDYNSSIFGKLSILIFQIIIPYFFIRKAKHITSSSIIKGIYVYIGCGFASLFFYILYRFNNYTVIFYILLISDLLNHSLRKYLDRDTAIFKNIIYSLIFCAGFVPAYFTDISETIGQPARWYVCWYPYYSVFQKEINPEREQYIRNLRNH